MREYQIWYKVTYVQQLTIYILMEENEQHNEMIFDIYMDVSSVQGF